MNLKNTFSGLLLFCAMQSSGQGKLTFSPEKPQAGDVITITYAAVSRSAADEKEAPLKAEVYALRKSGYVANDLSLRKSGNTFTGTVQTDTADNFVFFNLEAGGKNIDNNRGDGYWIQLYNGDQLKKGANLSLSNFYQYYGDLVGVDADPVKAEQYLEEEFKTDTAARKKNFVSYTRLYIKNHPDESDAFLQKQIEAQLKAGLNEEDDYGTLQSLYSLAKLPQQAKFISDLRKDKFPEGSWKINDDISSYMREKDVAKKETMLNAITDKIKNDPEWQSLSPNLFYFQSLLLNAYIQKGDWDAVDNAIKKFDIKGSDLASLYNSAAWDMQKGDKDLNKALELSEKSLEIAGKERKTPSGKKPDYLTKEKWDKSRESSYGMFSDTYAMINYKLGNYKKGMPYAEEAALKIAKGKNADENNTYALLAEKVQPAKKYVKQLEQFVKDGASTPDIKDILKRAYVKQHQSENGYDDYLSALEKDAYNKMVTEIKKGILGDAAPSFVLKDLHGNQVSLASLKDKVVVVDFWATWCGPCKASFPGMQKMVTQYKDDNEVKFVFVDTWENVEDKEKNAGDFITAQKYDFHVLMDNDSKVVEQFKVSGIPTKFIIDKKGVIRFKSIGFGGDDKLLAELPVMIDIAKTM